MDFDWKKVVGTVAPTIATMLGGPLAGAGVKILAGQLLGDENASQEQVAEAVAGMKPEQIIELKKIDADLKKQFADNGIKLAELSAQQDQAYVNDTADARRAHAGDRQVFLLGVSVLVLFFVIASGAVWGAFAVLTGAFKIDDPGVLAAVFGLVGSVVGYFAANSQQVIGFFFGSSRSSKGKDEALAQAVAQFGKR